jgi:hypothetical protein
VISANGLDRHILLTLADGLVLENFAQVSSLQVQWHSETVGLLCETQFLAKFCTGRKIILI